MPEKNTSETVLNTKILNFTTPINVQEHLFQDHESVAKAEAFDVLTPKYPSTFCKAAER